MLTEELTRAEFARLRDDTLRQIAPPGTSAIRRRVARRRSVAMACAGFGTAVVVGGTWTAVGPGPGPGRAPAPAADYRASSMPIVADATLLPSMLHAIARENLSKPLQLVGLPATLGLHRFNVVCSGSGGGTVTVTAGHETVTAKVTCGVPPATNFVELTVTVPAQRMTIRVDWDEGTTLRNTETGWAVQIIG